MIFHPSFGGFSTLAKPQLDINILLFISESPLMVHLHVHVARVHMKEKRVSNCTMPVHKHPYWSTKYTCVCLVLNWDVLLSKHL